MFIPIEVLIFIAGSVFSLAVGIFSYQMKQMELRTEKSIESESKLQDKENTWMQKIFEEKIKTGEQKALFLDLKIDEVSKKATGIGITLHDKVDGKGEKSGVRLGTVEERLAKLEGGSKN